MSYPWQKYHAEQPPRDEPVDGTLVAWGEPILAGAKISTAGNRNCFELLVKIISFSQDRTGFVIGSVGGRVVPRQISMPLRSHGRVGSPVKQATFQSRTVH